MSFHVTTTRRRAKLCRVFLSLVEWAENWSDHWCDDCSLWEAEWMSRFFGWFQGNYRLLSETMVRGGSTDRSWLHSAEWAFEVAGSDHQAGKVSKHLEGVLRERERCLAGFFLLSCCDQRGSRFFSSELLETQKQCGGVHQDIARFFFHCSHELVEVTQCIWTVGQQRQLRASCRRRKLLPMPFSANSQKNMRNVRDTHEKNLGKCIMTFDNFNFISDQWLISRVQWFSTGVPGHLGVVQIFWAAASFFPFQTKLKKILGTYY